MRTAPSLVLLSSAIRQLVTVIDVGLGRLNAYQYDAPWRHDVIRGRTRAN